LTIFVHPRSFAFIPWQTAVTSKVVPDSQCPEFMHRTFWQRLLRRKPSRVAFLVDFDTWEDP
jgi:hypothetical protein